ncbi:hypothetical protein BG015_011857 [Linnemannia schmuckeri]|uniref:HCP-like protein n=1 Tax=Linnemannia schmuckeri TaxID=64567 RepID=A0A9P5S734_9FUNG|nr:hypothetical protein BG015_011857 [Linnemannia schmuckeri]
MAQEASSQENYQAIRSVHKSLRLSAIPPASTDDVFYVVCYVDPETQKEFVFWEDILQAFEEGVHVRDKAKMIPFLRGSDLKILEPRRIAAMPDTVLDVIVGGPLVDTEVKSPRNVPEEPASVPLRVEKTVEKTDKTAVLFQNGTTIGTIERHSVHGLENAAMDDYSHINRPAAAPSAQGLQVWSYVPPPTDKASLMHHHSGSTSSAHSLGPQEYLTTSSSAQSSRSQEFSTPGRDFTKAVIGASQGDNNAQVALGDMYKEGQGVEQDYMAAMDWYLKAASQDNPEGQHRVGVMYSLGSGVPKDNSVALEWFLKAAEQGHAGAQYNVGLYHQLGREVPQDYAKATEWYHKAADQGNTDALKMLDKMSKKYINYI